MLLFRRIFDFKKSSVPRLEQRHSHRYAPGKEFPLRARLQVGIDPWPGRVLNLSTQGLGLLLDRDAGISAGQTGRLHLELDHYELEFNARLAHVEAKADGWHYGLTFSFDDFSAQKTYLQLLQPISIGCSLLPMAVNAASLGKLAPADVAFRGESDSELNFWRENSPANSLHRFEFLLPGYLIKADTRTRQLDVTLRPPTDRPEAESISAVPLDLSDDAKADVRQLFRWIVPNVPSSLPIEIRMFLQSFAR